VAKLFISYRRDDSRSITLRLAETLTQNFGEEHIFCDTDSIRVGQDWPSRITRALSEATVLLCVIGPQWLRLCNEWGQRRIDLEGDWVCDEVATAINNGVPVLPILVCGAKQVAPAALPERILALHAKQSYALRDEHWQHDVTPLVDELISEYNFQRVDSHATAADVIYPPPVDRVKALTPQELDAALERLPQWRLVKRPQPGGKGAVRTELYRSFRFADFEDASHFMFVAARYSSKHGHHPDWQNLWINLQVWLTTWDIGHRPSVKDVRLALYLDKLYEEYDVPQDS
jgi:pterin-4a-carbinolamine dehydratase